MKLNTQSVMSDLDRYEIPLEDRSYLLSVGFARALAYSLAIPTSKVEDPYKHFAETHKAYVDTCFGEINERLVLNIDAAADLCQRLWIFRYRLVYNADNTAVRSFLDAVVKVGSRELPPALSELLIKYQPSDVLELIARSCGESLVEGE